MADEDADFGLTANEQWSWHFLCAKNCCHFSHGHLRQKMHKAQAPTQLAPLPTFELMEIIGLKLKRLFSLLFQPPKVVLDQVSNTKTSAIVWKLFVINYASTAKHDPCHHGFVDAGFVEPH